MFVKGIEGLGELDGHVENLIDRLQATFADPRTESAAFHKFREDDHFLTRGAEETTRHEVRMLWKIDPRLDLDEEIAEVLRAMQPRSLSREQLARRLTPHLVGQPHTAGIKAVLHLKVFQDYLPDLPCGRKIIAAFRRWYCI